VVVVTGLDRLKDPSRFTSWLYGITRRVVARHRTRAWVRRWLGEPLEDPPSTDGDVVDRLAGAETAEQVWAILDALPTRQREVLVLADLEGRPLSEIAELLDLPLGTVKSRLRLGRERFRRLAQSRRLDVHPAVAVRGSA
jgi:RNA polymerase sigma-70 factor (ECF subfamily)